MGWSVPLLHCECSVFKSSTEVEITWSVGVFTVEKYLSSGGVHYGLTNDLFPRCTIPSANFKVSSCPSFIWTVWGLGTKLDGSFPDSFVFLRRTLSQGLGELLTAWHCLSATLSDFSLLWGQSGGNFWFWIPCLANNVRASTSMTAFCHGPDVIPPAALAQVQKDGLSLGICGNSCKHGQHHDLFLAIRLWLLTGVSSLQYLDDLHVLKAILHLLGFDEWQSMFHILLTLCDNKLLKEL